MGYVATVLIPRLVGAGYRVRGADRLAPDERGPTGTAYLAGDLREPDFCERACAGVDTLVHTAALQYHSGMPRFGRRAFFEQNVVITRRLVDAAIRGGVRHIVMMSSDMVYGLPRGRPFVETDMPDPIGPYGRSKLASEQLCLAARERGLRVTVLRPRLIMGAGRLGIMQRLFDRIRAGKAIPLIGNGRNRYQMVSVDDVASATLLAVRNPLDDVFNLGSPDPPIVRELLTGVCRRASSTSRLRSLPLRAAQAALWTLDRVRLSPMVPEQFRIAGADYVLDPSRAIEKLGWRPRVSDLDALWAAYESYVTGTPAPRPTVVAAGTAPAQAVVGANAPLTAARDKQIGTGR